MSSKQILLGFLPWIAFSAISTRVGPGAVGMAALLALVLAVVMVIRSRSHGQSLKLIEVTAVVTFAVYGVWALIDPASDDFLASYGRGVAALVLAAVIAVSLLVRPFTEQYARESVPQQYWDSPEFHAKNRKISAAWAGAVAVMGLGHLLAGALAATEPTGYLIGRPIDLIFNWLIPGALIVMTVRYTRTVAGDQATHTTQARP
jgi:intracellular septation protein A